MTLCIRRVIIKSTRHTSDMLFKNKIHSLLFISRPSLLLARITKLDEVMKESCLWYKINSRIWLDLHRVPRGNETIIFFISQMWWWWNSMSWKLVLTVVVVLYQFLSNIKHIIIFKSFNTHARDTINKINYLLQLQLSV